METLDYFTDSIDRNSCLVWVVDIISITIGADEKFLKTGEDPILTIGSDGHALSVFVNGQLVGNIQIG